MAKKSYSNWAKSFGRSMKFGAKEILSEMAPNIAETAGSLQEDVRDLRQDIRRLRANKRQIVNYMLGEEEQFSKYGNILWKNAKSSFKNGKWIDPKRSDKLMMEAMGMGDMDFGDFDDSMDVGSFNDTDFGSVEMGPSTIVNMTGPSTEAMNAVSETVATGFQRLDKANKNAFAISEALEKRFHAEKMGQLQSISSNLVNIVTFNNETWSTYVKASMEFYDKNLELMNSMNDALLRISPVPKKKSERVKQENPVDMFMSGGFSLKGYSQFVAKNARKSFQNSLLGTMLPLVNNEMMLADFAANPLGALLKFGIENVLLPDRFKTGLAKMDRSFHNFLPAALTKLGNYNGDNGIIQLFSEIFGINTKVGIKRFNQGDYEHGAIPYDGESKAALTRVIPGYLSRMTAILEVIARRMKGGVSEDKLEEMIHNNTIIYNDSKVGPGAGSFMRLKEAEKEQRREERDIISRSYSDSRYELRSALGKYDKISGINIDDLLENYIIGATHSQDELKLNDYNQIKKFIKIGMLNGKAPSKNDKYLEDPEMQRLAEAMQFALTTIPSDVQLGLYGRERHEARTNLNNYYKYHASDDEYGAGKNTYLSKLNRGSITDLYASKNSDRYVEPRYMIERLDDGHYYMPQRAIDQYNEEHKTKFKKADDVYHDWQRKKAKSNNRYIYSSSEEETVKGTVEKTLTQRIKETIQLPFDKIADAFNFIDKKMHDFIFGENGLGGNLKDLVLGKKGEDGKYSGGWFSEAINGGKEIYTSTKNYLFGDGKNEEGILSKPLDKFKSLMEDYFLGEEKEEIGPDGKKVKVKRKSIFETIQSTLVEGFGSLASTLFGNVDDESGRAKSLAEAKEAFKKAIPDIGKGAGLGAIVGTVSGFGGFGLLGSLFLPGGPIGGALVGGAMGLLSQSKAFREMLFGKEEDDGKGGIKRVGGLISSDIIDWFKKKKTAILGGASLGVLSTATGHGIAFGLMPSIAVGAFGPVIAGAAWGLISHSERFRTMIFGREGEDGKRIGGFINANMVESVKKSFPRGIAGAISGVLGMGVISQMGLVGSMVATGPIPAAILGASFGIASASKEFTNRMFGYVDASGKYHSGALDKIKNFFTWEIFAPVKQRIMEEWHNAQVYLRKNVFRPIRRAFFPIKAIFIDIGKSIKKKLEDAFSPVKEGIEMVFFALTDNLKKVFSPIIKAVSSIGNWMIKRFKTAMNISIQTALLPLRIVGGLARMYMYGKEYKSSVKNAVLGIGEAIKNKSGVLGAIGSLGKAVFNPESESLGTANAEDERLKQEDEQFELEGNSFLQAQRKNMEAMREKMRAGGYGLTEEQIAEKFRSAKKRSEAEASVVDAGAKSKSLSEQLQSVQIQETAKSNLHLGDIKQYVSAIASSIGVKLGITGSSKDDNAEIVDERNRLEKEKEEQKEQQTKIADNIEKLVENTDPKKKKPEKKGFWSTLFEGISSIGSGIFGFIGTLGKIAIAASGIYGILKMIFGDKSKGGKSEQLAHSEQAGRAVEIGLKKGSQWGIKLAKYGIKLKDSITGSSAYNFMKNLGGALKTDVGNAGRAVYSGAKSFVGNIGDSLLNRKMSLAEYTQKFGKKNLGVLIRDHNLMQKMSYDDFIKSGFADGIHGADRYIEYNKLKNISFDEYIEKYGNKGKKALEEEYAKYLANPQNMERTRLGKAVDKVKSILPTFKETRLGKAVESAKSFVDTAKTAVEGRVDKFTNFLGKKVGEGKAKAAKFGESIMSRINTALDDFLKSEIVSKVFGKAKEKITKFKDMIVELGTHIGNSKTLGVLKKLFPTKFAKAVTNTTAALSGIGIAVTVGFSIYDGITGALEADRLFDVNPADVTLKMRLISSFTNTFFGLPPMMWIDLLLTAASFGALALSDTIFGRAMKAAGYDLKDFDHRKMFARMIFDLSSDDEDIKKLDAAQKKFDAEFKEYARVNNKGDDFSKEQYREEKGNLTTWQKYGAPIVDKVLGIGQDAKTGIKSFGERISTWMDDLTRWFKDAIKAITSFSPIEWFKEMIGLGKDWSLKAKFNEIGNMMSSWLPDVHPIDKVSNVASSRWDKIKGAASAAKSFFFGKGNSYNYMGDAKWKNTYGDDMCAQMTLANMFGISPDTASRLGYASDITPYGTRSSYFEHAAGQLGVGYRENRTPQDLYNAITSNALTTVGGSSSNPNSPFYGNGHYIMTKGMNPDGTVNIVNPTSKDKSTVVSFKQLLHDSIGSGGYSGSFIGAGRIPYVPNSPSSVSDFKRMNEKPKDVMGMMDTFNQRNIRRNGKASKEKEAIAKKYMAKERRRIANKAKPNKPRKVGLTELLTGFGLGLKNLFSSIISGKDYKWVQTSDLFGGLSSLFGGGRSGSTLVSGKGCDTGIRAAECALSHPDGEQWMGNVTADSNIQCDSYAREIYHEAGLEMPRQVVTDQDFKSRNAYHLNDGSYEPQLGDLVDWPKHVGIYVGGYNVNSRQSKGGVHTLSFEDAEAIWGPIVGFGSVSDYTGEPVHEVHGGGGGNFDTSEGRIETKKAVWNFLVNDLKMNRNGAAGVMGNIQQESGFRTEAIGDNGTSGGLVQWHDTSYGVGRFTNLKNFASEMGKSWDTVEPQLGYLAKELDEGYSDVYNNVASANSVEDAVKTWVNDFERPADKPGEIVKRTPIAQAYYDDHTNFIGGANSPYSAAINGMLTNWLGRYQQRGQAKRASGNMERYVQAYANAYRTPGIISTPYAQVSRTSNGMRVLPAKVDTGGASMDDLLLSIRALDSHSELSQIIGYLAIISAKVGSGSGKPTLSPEDETKLKRIIEKAKIEAKSADPRNRLNSGRYKDMVDAVNGLDGLSRSSFEVAIDIAKGGEFRKT